MKLSDEARAVVRRDGVIARRDHPGLTGAMARLLRDGELTAVLPGVYATPETGGERAARLAALSRWAPEAVLTGRTAAQLTFWPALPWSTVECPLQSARDPQPGFAFSKRRVAPELVLERRGFRVTRPCHRLLRAAGITGWKANLPVHVRGERYFLDVGFPDLRLVLEIDGRIHQTNPELFESDRWRQNDLVLAGWMVLRFTWRMLEDHPDVVVERVREAICTLRASR